MPFELKGRRINFKDFFFRPEYFLLSAELTKPFLGDVVAIVNPTSDQSLEVDILSIISGDRELIGFLKRDAEWEIIPVLRSAYLNEARAGLEGDPVEGL